MFSTRRISFLNICCTYVLLLNIDQNVEGQRAEAYAQAESDAGLYRSGNKVGTSNYGGHGLYKKCGNNIQIRRLTDPQITDPQIGLAGPSYSREYQSIFYTNALGGSVFRLEIKTNKIFSTYLGDGDAQGVIPLKHEPGKFLVNFDDLISELIWDGVSTNSSLRTIKRPVPEQPYPGFYTGVPYIGPNGAFFFYSKPKVNKSIADILPRQCSLYNIIEGCQKKLLGGLSIGIGIVFIGEKIYLTDVYTKIIYSAIYERGSNSFKNLQVFLDFTKEKIPGSPSSLAADKDGNLWMSATYNGRRIMKVDPNTAKIICSIELPAGSPTDFVFGPSQKDEKLNTIYLCTRTFELPSLNEFDGTLLGIYGLPVDGVPRNEGDYDEIFINPNGPQIINNNRKFRYY